MSAVSPIIRSISDRWSVRKSIFLAAMVAPAFGFAAAATDVASVYARTANGYVRTRLPDHSFKPETYTFAEGGRWDGVVGDPSMDGMPFMRIAQELTGPLRQQNYVPAGKPRDIDLLIVVFWGTTSGAEHDEYGKSLAGVAHGLQDLHAVVPPKGFVEWVVQGREAPNETLGDPQVMMRHLAEDEVDQALMYNRAENSMRDRNNMQNALILGYYDAFIQTLDLPLMASSRDTIEDLEADRYFVVLKAYDFQLLWKNKQRKLLWETRYSIRQQRNQFDEVLAGMTQTASQYFGRDSGRLLRRVVPVGRVDVGTPIIVDTSAK